VNNAGYFHAAYVAAALVYAAYAASLWWRGRALDRRDAALRRREGGGSPAGAAGER
jgi:hypothetical protein